MKVNISVKKIQELVYDSSQDMLRGFLQEGDMSKQDFTQLSTQVNSLLWNLSHTTSIQEIFIMVERGQMELIGYENIDDLISDLQ